MNDSYRPRTVGDALAGMELTTAAAALGFLVAIVGSLGPWVTTPFASAAGTNGDGLISIALAVLGLLGVLTTRRAELFAASFGTLILGLGMYEVIHIHHKVMGATLFGQQFAHVGWGVYAVAVGGLISIGASVWSLTSDRG